MKQQIRNSIIYSAELPDANAMADHLAKIPFTPVAESSLSSAGFETCSITGELPTPLVDVDGYFFTMRFDCKIIPNDVVASMLADEMKAFAKRAGRPANRKDRQNLKEAIIQNMLPTAPIRTKRITAYYDRSSKLLFVNTTNKGLASKLMNLAVHAVGSVKTSTIHISDLSNGLSVRLKAFLSGDKDAFSPEFAPVERVKLVKKIADSEKQVISYRIDQLEAVADAIIARIDDFYRVSDIQIDAGSASFLLNDAFQFRGIQLPSDDGDAEEVVDLAFALRVQVTAELLMISESAQSMLKLFGYKEPVYEEKPADSGEEE